MMKFPSLVAIYVVGAVGIVQGLSVNKIEIVGSAGTDAKNPIKEDDSFNLKCSLSDSWVYCAWSHTIEGQYTNDNKELDVYCSASRLSDHGATCANAGTADSSYSSRITMDLSTTSCGIKIKDADPKDIGQWKCHAGGYGAAGGEDFREIDVFVSNQSKVVFKEPDLLDDDNQVITYDLQESKPQIDAKCRAYGGVPEPSFVWYFENDRNEIEDYTPRINRGTDPVYGDYIEERITWSPTIEDMCKKYDLNEKVCDDNTRKNRNFNFNLLCQANQGNFYTQESEDDMAEVIVEVTDGASSIVAGNLALLMCAILSWNFGLSV